MMNNKVKLGILTAVVAVGMIIYKIIRDKKNEESSTIQQEASSTNQHDSMWN